MELMQWYVTFAHGGRQRSKSRPERLAKASLEPVLVKLGCAVCTVFMKKNCIGKYKLHLYKEVDVVVHDFDARTVVVVDPHVMSRKAH